MIEQITLEKLREYGFKEDDIRMLQVSKLYEWKGRDEGLVWASFEEKVILTGKDAAHKIYLDPKSEPVFPYSYIDLVPEYYSAKEKKHLENEQTLAGILYNEGAAKEAFKQSEINWATREIASKKRDIEKLGSGLLKKTVLDVKHLENYITWLSSPIKNDLSAFEIALRHRYLELAKIEKELTSSRAVGLKYAPEHNGRAKNIESAYSDIVKKRKCANKQQLKNVHCSLVGYPDVQKAVANDIDKLE